MTKANYWL